MIVMKMCLKTSKMLRNYYINKYSRKLQRKLPALDAVKRAEGGAKGGHSPHYRRFKSGVACDACANLRRSSSFIVMTPQMHCRW